MRTTTILTLHQKWPGLAQAFELTRRRTIKGQTTVEVVYGITSLKAEQADARHLLGLTRGHWGIENRLHYVRDVTLGEDACRVRKGTAPQVLAAPRNAVVCVASTVARACEAVVSRATVFRRFADRPNEALQAIGLPSLQ